jgi:ATP-dependent DNA helicase DinG
MMETISSPFDYEQQSALLISQDISKLSEVSDQEFASELARATLEMAKVSQGRMMVLFTSYQMLRLTHQFLKAPLQELGIFLFAQGVDSGSRGKLTKNFQSQEKAILLGTNSFWEGIDIPGEDLSCLVIVKLPFTPPNTPFYEAKAEQLKEENKNPFMDYALPQAVIRFKQGFGRLIRKSTDTGVVVVFDRRIIEARYGQAFLRSLPPIQIQAVDKEQLVREIQQRLG